MPCSALVWCFILGPAIGLGLIYVVMTWPQPFLWLAG